MGVWSKLRLAGLGLVVTALVLGAVSLGLFAVIRLLLPVAAWIAPSLELAAYDLGAYGAHPTVDYVSFNITSPLFSHLQWESQCDQGLVLLTPRGTTVEPPGPLIVEPSGDLVWTSDQFGGITNLKVQEYKGQKFLTFWAGTQSSTFGAGIYHMVDSRYKSIHQVSAVGEGLHGDLHEFDISRDGTALITVYHVTTMDLTSMGRPVQGWIIDSTFQEINIETGELLFEWKASEHFNSTDSYASNPFAGYRESNPFDFFHINSIEKDSAGNFLISSRHTHTVTTVNGQSGEIMWVLGGEKNEFTDLSNGKAITFTWQHDARWVSEEKGLLTLFDNGEAGPLHIDAPYSRAMMLKLDITNRTVELMHEYISMQQIRTPSQGSVQVLPESNNVFVGWGHSAAYSEFKEDGTLICESHFGASWYYWWGRITSYRSWKTNEWRGTPDYPPTIRLRGSDLYVSWNGATEVAAWELQGATAQGQFEEVDTMRKVGFEGKFVLPSTKYYTHWRVAARDKDGEVLRYSNVTQRAPGWTVTDFMMLSVIFGSIVFGGSILYRIWTSRSGSRTMWFMAAGDVGDKLKMRKYRYSPL